MSKNFMTLFGTSGDDAELEAERRLEETREMISQKAALNNTTGRTSAFGSPDDFPDPHIRCEHITGPEAQKLWADAVRDFVINRQAAAANRMVARLPHLEVKPGAAHPEGEKSKELTFDPFRYERKRLLS